MSDVDTNANVSDAHIQSGDTPAQVDTTTEATAVPGDAPAADDGQPKGDQPGGKKPIGPRISELTAKRRDAERRAELAESLVERLTAALAGKAETKGDPKPADDTGPKQSDYRTYEEYLDARADWRAKSQFDRLVEDFRGQASKRNEEQGQAARMATFQSSLDEQGASVEGFEEAAAVVFDDDKFPISRPMADYLMDAADHKAGMVKWLADNRAEASRIYKLSPAAAAKELAKVDAQLGQKPPPRATTAPPPAPRAAGRGAPPASIETMSWEDTLKWARKQTARG